MIVDILTTRHPFLEGKPKRMLIYGKWVEAASGKDIRQHQSVHR